MFEINYTGYSAGIYADVQRTYMVHSDLNAVQVEEKVREYLKAHHEPTRNYGEWRAQQRSDPSVYYSGYYRLTKSLGDRWSVETIQPSTE